MKKLFLIVLCIYSIFISISVSAQIYASSLLPDNYIGIKAGADYQQITGSPFVPAYNPGYIAGVYASRHWRRSGVRIEITASDAHYTTAKLPNTGLYAHNSYDSTHKADFTCTYISVPLLAEIALKRNKIFFEIGPQYNYMLSIADNNGAYTKEFKTDNILKSGEFCFDFGINAKLTRNFNLGVRYVIGITSVNKDTYYRAYDNWTEYAAQIALSYSLRHYKK